ncbi:MAG: hypothetical protein ACKVH8_23900 [Pirellulales bacterium]
MQRIFHTLLAMIASSSDSILAKQVLYLVQEIRILCSRIPGAIHTKPDGGMMFTMKVAGLVHPRSQFPY